VTLNHTIDAFRSIFPFLEPNCIISDVASVKTQLQDFYYTCGFPYVSTHPMFGPTFATLGSLDEENTIIISEGNHLGKVFFKDLYSRLKLNIFEYTFDEHDKVVAYSLGIPFASTLVFAATMIHQDAPGTTFKRHMKIAHGLMSEDDYLLSEILFNPRTPLQLSRIQEELAVLQEIITQKDTKAMKTYLSKIRKKIE
jgi:prephenate dehydrogenase